MLNISCNGVLPLAAAPLRSIATAATAAGSTLATHTAAATPPSGPHYSDIFQDDTPVGTRPGIQDYFDHGEFSPARPVAEHQALVTAAAAAVYFVPLFQIAFQSVRGVANLLPGTKSDFLQRSPEDALSKPKWYDQINTIGGWWEDTFGPWRNIAAPGVAVYIGMDLYHDLFRILSCYSFDVVLGLGAWAGLHNLMRANKTYLGVRFPTLKRISLYVKAFRNEQARRELDTFNQLISATTCQRRHMMGPFYYRPRLTPAPQPDRLTGEHIA